MTGIICAMETEAAKIVSEMTDVREKIISGIAFRCGKIGKHDTVLAVCGVGKVYAALCSEAMILNYSPEVIVNVGIAGSLSKKFALLDTVIADRVCQHDMDTSAVGDEIGYIQNIGCEMKTDPETNEAIIEAAGKAGIELRYAKIATGDIFVGSDSDRKKISERFNAQICEMEGGAIAQVCTVNKVRFAILRTVSDSECEDFAVFSEKAADIAAGIILNYIKSI